MDIEKKLIRISDDDECDNQDEASVHLIDGEQFMCWSEEQLMVEFNQKNIQSQTQCVESSLKFMSKCKKTMITSKKVSRNSKRIRKDGRRRVNKRYKASRVNYLINQNDVIKDGRVVQFEDTLRDYGIYMLLPQMISLGNSENSLSDFNICDSIDLPPLFPIN